MDTVRSRYGEGDLDKIRVLLANHPVMVPDVIRRLMAEQDDMELVADCRGPMKILQEVGRAKADAVIFAQESSEEPGLCSQLLAVYPDLTIVGVTPDMGTTFTQQLCSHRRNMTNTEDKDRNIMQVIRETVNNRCGEKQA